MPSVACEAEAKVISWRIDVLVSAGYSGSDALLIADSDADLHQAVELLKAGCPAITAIRILL